MQFGLSYVHLSYAVTHASLTCLMNIPNQYNSIRAKTLT